DFARPLRLPQHRPQLLVGEKAVRAGVKLVKVYRLHAQRAQRSFKLLAHAGGRKVFRALHEPVIMMAELAGHDPPRAVVAGHIIPDQPFGQVITVTLSRVHQVDAQLRPLIKNGIRLSLRIIMAPLPAQLPRADPNDRHPQPRAAQNPVAHGPSLTRPFPGREVNTPVALDATHAALHRGRAVRNWLLTSEASLHEGSYQRSSI